MTVAVVAREELPIRSEEDIVRVRRLARALAQRGGFDAFASAALMTAASEMARNTWQHGGGGLAAIEEVRDGRRAGVRMTFADRGPGIPDLERVLRGGYSTASSLGLGVSGTRRLVDEFAIDTRPGEGTTIVVTKWTRR
ncbi:MAG: anti-sigma regulatory factor [Myxococcales bacterium]|nr:anti-sigma regulatory factor [Myxococcales bacterium]